MNKAVAAFLGKHNFPVHQDINSVIDALLNDMHEGLAGRKADEDMIKTFSHVDNQIFEVFCGCSTSVTSGIFIVSVSQHRFQLLAVP